MDTLMELDELKLAWATLDRLEQQNALTLKIFTDGKLDKARSRLRPLVRGQVAQIVFGALVALMAGSFWPGFLSVPHLLIAGILLHLYGIVTIVFGARTLWMIHHIDYAAPVLSIQKQLADLRRFYIRNGMLAGMSWWLIWIPFLMLLMGMFRVDLYAHAPSVIYIGTGIGVVGLLGVWLLHRCSRDGRRPRLARFLHDSMTGTSLLEAQAVIDEVARFEKE
jgi:serine/threonine-protein kinase